MKIKFLLAVAFAFFSVSAFAQKQKPTVTSKSNVETIIIDGSGRSSTEIEIKNGYIYINGEQISDVSSSGDKRIVVENNNSSSEKNNFPWLQDMENKFPRKAMLGVYTAKTDNNKGTIIQEVIPNSAADKAGLKEGDIITALNDLAINSPEDLVNAVKNKQPGDQVNIAYTRSNNNQTTAVTLTRATPAEFFRSYRYNGTDMPDFNFPNPFKDFGDNFDAMRGISKPKLGVQIETVSNGARIIDITKNTPAWNAGLQKGDVIYSFDGKDIKNADDLQRAVRTSEAGKKLLVIFERDDKDFETDVIFSNDNSKEKM